MRYIIWRSNFGQKLMCVLIGSQLTGYHSCEHLNIILKLIQPQFLINWYLWGYYCM